jgi:single-strand DNA-binding protein
MPAIDVTIVGNLARNPETKVTAGGVTACTFTIASSERYRDGDGQWKDGPTSWVRCCAWRDLADHINESFGKGDRVIVTGRLQEREYEHNGTKRSVWEVTVADAGPSVKFALAKPAKATRNSAPPAKEDPWQADPGDPPPF